MKNNKILFFFFILTAFTACKKDKLKGDKEIFVGKWKWIYSGNGVRKIMLAYR